MSPFSHLISLLYSGNANTLLEHETVDFGSFVPKTIAVLLDYSKWPLMHVVSNSFGCKRGAVKSYK